MSVSSIRRIHLAGLAPAVFIAVAFVIFAVCAAGARAWLAKIKPAGKPTAAVIAQGRPQTPNRLHGKLSLQPEADRQRRRLGQRFLAPGREVAMLVGTLTLGATRYTARITRTQDEEGESLAIGLNGGPDSLTWNGKDGARSAGSPATGDQRSLIERIALDSPDQFVQAQLRGAAYFTVAHNARPAEAGGADNYSGPMWDLVRIAEPAPGVNKPQSLWRLYFINSATGLIEKIVSQEQGETITAEVSGWTSQGGEAVPTQITWTRNNQVVMELTFSNIAHGPKQ
jgi:hypothetical protein